MIVKSRQSTQSSQVSIRILTLVVRTVLCPPKCAHSGAVPFNVTAVTAYPNQNLIYTHVDLREASTSGTSICHLDTSTVDVSVSICLIYAT